MLPPLGTGSTGPGGESKARPGPCLSVLPSSLDCSAAEGQKGDYEINNIMEKNQFVHKIKSFQKQEQQEKFLLI